jgi:hypothetical protein
MLILLVLQMRSEWVGVDRMSVCSCLFGRLCPLLAGDAGGVTGPGRCWGAPRPRPTRHCRAFFAGPRQRPEFTNHKAWLRTCGPPNLSSNPELHHLSLTSTSAEIVNLILQLLSTALTHPIKANCSNSSSNHPLLPSPTSYKPPCRPNRSSKPPQVSSPQALLVSSTC